MEGPWEVRQGGEQGELLADHKDDDKDSAHSDSCIQRVFHCLSHVPCASLIAWIILILGLGGVTGSLLFGAHKTRELLEDDRMLWFIEYTIIGVICGMFVIGTSLLVVGHCSSEPTSRHAFNSSRKNFCARALNIFMLVLSYLLTICWVLVTTVFALPAALLILLMYQENNKDVRCINLSHYGFWFREICKKEGELERFTNRGYDLLICYLVAYISALLIIISLIHFLMVISANVTHLRESRFATMNAYDVETAEEAQNSKHVVDTTM